MAKIDFVLQAVTDRFHAEELRKLLSKAGCKRVLVSVAFARQDGVDALAASLKPVANTATFFVGIRNGVTSVQGLKRLLEIGVHLFAVDTASRTTIFHPKLFLTEGEATAALIIGSANLTFPGLHNNIEAGAIFDLDLSEPGDKALLANIRKALDELPPRFPEHVFHIKDQATLEKLFDEGRLEDEDVVEAPTVSTPVRKGTRDALKPMKLAAARPAPAQACGRAAQARAKASTRFNTTAGRTARHTSGFQASFLSGKVAASPSATSTSQRERHPRNRLDALEERRRRRHRPAPLFPRRSIRRSGLENGPRNAPLTRDAPPTFTSS